MLESVLGRYTCQGVRKRRWAAPPCDCPRGLSQFYKGALALSQVQARGQAVCPCWSSAGEGHVAGSTTLDEVAEGRFRGAGPPGAAGSYDSASDRCSPAG